MNAIKKLQEANRYKSKFELVDIPLDGDEVIHAKLSSPDIFAMHEEMDELKDVAYGELCEKGYDQKPINHKVWKEETEGYFESKEFMELTKVNQEKKRAELNKSKPKNLAEQRAPYLARTRIIKTIIPKLLRDAKTDELLFSSQAEINAAGELIGRNPELMGLLSSAFGKLYNKEPEKETEEEEIEELEKLEEEELKN